MKERKSQPLLAEKAVACSSKPEKMAATRSEDVLPEARRVVPSAQQEDEWPSLPEECAQAISKSKAQCTLGVRDSLGKDLLQKII